MLAKFEHITWNFDNHGFGLPMYYGLKDETNY